MRDLGKVNTECEHEKKSPAPFPETGFDAGEMQEKYE